MAEHTHHHEHAAAHDRKRQLIYGVAALGSLGLGLYQSRQGIVDDAPAERVDAAHNILLDFFVHGARSLRAGLMTLKDSTNRRLKQFSAYGLIAGNAVAMGHAGLSLAREPGKFLQLESGPIVSPAVGIAGNLTILAVVAWGTWGSTEPDDLEAGQHTRVDAGEATARLGAELAHPGLGALATAYFGRLGIRLGLQMGHNLDAPIECHDHAH